LVLLEEAIMAFRELNNILNWGDVGLGVEESPSLGRELAGKFVLIKDTLKGEGAVLLHHFLFGFLRPVRGRVCLISTEQSLFHYTFVAKKLALDLKKCQANGRLRYINALSHPFTWTLDTNTSTDTTSQQKQPTETFSLELGNNDEEESNALKPLYEKIKSFVEEGGDEERCIIIDNVSNIANAFLNPIHPLDWLHYCNILVKQSSKKVCLVALVHEDVEDAVDQSFVRSLVYKADLVMSVDGLPSGYSKDVNGQVVVMGRQIPTRQMHFKAMDNTVRFMYKGV
jgi:KaiC/GvpD/RAD55 family RecA-like ATPase